MKYFALGNDSQFYDLCDCGDFEAANESATDLLDGTGVHPIWLFDEDGALQVADRILSSFFGITTADIADWDLVEDEK
jgi:hypothetical protein